MLSAMSSPISCETARAILAVPLPPDNDAEASTIRDYLVKLLATLWDEREGFSTKRPFGNSGWHWDLYRPLGEAGFVTMTFDSDGDIDEFSDEERDKADKLIDAAIQELGHPCQTT